MAAKLGSFIHDIIAVLKNSEIVCYMTAYDSEILYCDDTIKPCNQIEST